MTDRVLRGVLDLSAKLLLHLSECFEQATVTPERTALPLALTHDELTSLAQSSRVTVTRVMGELRQEQVVFGTRGVYELDPVLHGAP